MSARTSASVRRVEEALAAKGSSAKVVELNETARTAEDAARSCGVAVGAIVKSLVFLVGESPVLVLVAGDRRCDMRSLPEALGVAGETKRADADLVRKATGFAIGGVAPVGHVSPLPVLVDASLGRFDRLFAAAGHPYCVFETNFEELVRVTSGRVSKIVAIA